MTISLFPQKKITNNSNIKKFVTHYANDDNWHEMDIQSGNLGYAWIHYSNIRLLKPKNILCVGSRYGLIPAICALACRDNNFGTVDFVDAGYDQDNQEHEGVHWGGVGLWRSEKGKDHFNAFGLNKFVKQHIMTTQDFFKHKKNKKKWGYAHLDGDHSYKGIKHDFSKTWPNITKNGIIGLHDINTPDNMGNIEYGTRLFWNEIKNKYPSYMEYPGICGLGILQKT